MELSADAINGIILRVYPYRESDLVLRVLSKEIGKVSLLARSARNSRRRFAGSFDMFDSGIFKIKPSRGSLPLVESLSSDRMFKALREDLTKLIAASVLCEGFDLLTIEAAAEESLFDLLSLSLNSVEAAPGLKEVLRSLYLGLSSLLKISGFLDQSLIGDPSRNNLVRLVNHIESCSEKKLNSKVALVDILGNLSTS